MSQIQKTRPNGVKGTVLNGTSPGRRLSTQQGAFDRHQVTACNTRTKMKIATWNVRTMHQAGKLQNVKEEAIRLKLDIFGLAEVRWLGYGKLVSEDHTLIYSGHKKEHKHGVGLLLSNVFARSVFGFHGISDRIIIVKLFSKPFNLSIIQVYAPTSANSEEEIEAFYNDLDDAYKQCDSQEMIVVMGDLNAKVGTEQDSQKVVVGQHGLGERNERGDLWVDWCTTHEQVIMNTWFQHEKRHLYTWKCPGDTTRNQIDYITINQRFRNSILQVKGYPGEDCASDHVPVIATMRVKLRKITKTVKKFAIY